MNNKHFGSKVPSCADDVHIWNFPVKKSICVWDKGCSGNSHIAVIVVYGSQQPGYTYN